MKIKNILIGNIFFLTYVVFAQETITEKLEYFNEIKVFCGIKVEIVKSNEAKIEISGKNAKETNFYVKKNRLKISCKLNKILSSKDLKVVVYYPSFLGEIDANQGAIVVSRGVIKQSQLLEASSQEGAYIDIEVDLRYLKVDIITGGVVKIRGVADNQNIELSTGSVYEGEELISRQTTASATTGSTARIFVKEILDASVKLGGAIIYSGRPTSLMIKKVLGGVITEKKKNKE